MHFQSIPRIKTYSLHTQISSRFGHLASFHKLCRSLHLRASLDAITPPLIARVHAVRIDRACSLLTPPVRLAAGRSNKRSHCLALRSSPHASSPRLTSSSRSLAARRTLHVLVASPRRSPHVLLTSPRRSPHFLLVFAAHCTQAAQRHATKHSAMQIIWRIQKKYHGC